jgi:hypothetical protein
VHALPSSHAVPSRTFLTTHCPLLGLQSWIVVVHCVGMMTPPRLPQTTGLPPTQLPPWQVSVCVQALPSLHVVPSDAAGFEHAPVAGSHVPATWH